MVLERAPRRGLEVAAGHRRLRGGPRRRPGVRRPDGADDVAIICRNTTEAINHLAYRLRLEPDDVVVTTVVEHHANLLPWARLAPRRYVECGADGTFGVDDVDRRPRPGRGPGCSPSPAPRTSPAGCRRIDDDHRRRPRARGARARRRRPARPAPTAARRPPTSSRGAATRCTPRSAPACCIGPRADLRRAATRSWPAAAPSTSSTSTRWCGPTRPTGRRRARPTSSAPSPSTPPSTSSPRIGWDAIRTHDDAMAAPPARRARPASTASASSAPRPVPAGCPSPRSSSRACPTRWSPPGSAPSTPSASATAASAPTPTCSACSTSTPRRSSEYRDAVLRGDRRRIPGAVRASAGLSTTGADIDRFLEAVGRHRRRRAAAGALRPGPAHRRLLARTPTTPPGRAPAAATRRLLRPRLKPRWLHLRVLGCSAAEGLALRECGASRRSAPIVPHADQHGHELGPEVTASVADRRRRAAP